MELDWGQHSTSQKLPRWIHHEMQGTRSVWITRAWPPYVHKHGWLFKKSTKTPSLDSGNQDGTQWVQHQYGSVPLVLSERKPIINTVNPTQHNPRREKTSMIHNVSLSSGSQQLENPLGDHGAIIGKLLEIKYSHTPLSPLQRAWSWWTWLGSYHEEHKIFGDQVPWRCVLRIRLTTRFVPTPEYLHLVDFAC